MRRDHRPYYVKKAYLKVQELYTRHFLAPHFDRLGKGWTFIHPWNVLVFGGPISLGDYANVITTGEKKVRLTVWSEGEGKGRIEIGDYCLICPGVRISSATEIVVGDNCMFASDAYVTDSDWHDTYNRVSPVGKTLPVRIEQNVWVGDGSIVCKGVTVGENSIIGARSVVVSDIPPNVIAAGNPAKVVRELDPSQQMTTRAHWFADPERLSRQIDEMDRDMLRYNTIRDWIRSLLKPAVTD